MKDRSLETAMPQAFAELRAIATLLESHFDETQDIEFSVERGQLFVLQTRGAKLTPAAAVRIAVELVEEGRISADRALRQIDAGSLRNLLIPRLPAPEELAQRGVHAVARGLAASRGAAAGCIVLDAAAAETRPGEDRILVRSDTSSEDVDTMRKVAGVLTAAGGLTSHAAVVARAMGKPCITGATELHVDYQTRTVLAHGERRHVFREGEALTIDGSRGLIYSGELPVEPAPSSPHVQVILRWADERRQAQVFAESRNPRAARVGMSFGADGVLVPLAHDGSTKDFRRAVGDHAPIVWAVDAESAPLAAKDLRPGQDILLVEADHEVGSIRASCSGFELWSVRPAEGVDAIVSSSSPPPGQTAWAAHGEAALTVGAVDVKPRALIVSPLDIPVARVRAACIE